MIELPAWGWQAVAGIAGGLALAAIIGFWRMSRQEARQAKPTEARFTLAPPLESQLDSRTPRASGFGRATRPASLESGAPRRTSNTTVTGGTLTGMAEGDHARTDDTLMRMLDRLREQNRTLADQLREAKAAATLPMSEALEPGANRPRGESLIGELEGQTERAQQAAQELQQLHARELGQLMQVTLEQIDALQQAHAAHTQAMQIEIERLKRLAGEAHPFDDGLGAAAAQAHAAARAAVQAPKPQA